LIVLVLLVAAAARAEDWPNWRGPRHDGISTETGWRTNWPADGPKVLWRAEVGVGFSSFAVADGRAFTMGNAGGKDTVWCFDAETGEVLWSHSYPCPLMSKYYEGGTHSTPTVHGGKVYTFSKTGQVLCLAAADGKVLWARDLRENLGLKVPTWGFASSVRIVDDLAVVNAGSAGVAMNKDDGRIVWKSGETPSGYATPVVFDAGGKQGLLIFAEKSLTAVEAKTGNPLWSHRWQTRHDVNAADPIVINGRVFISSGYNRGCALLGVGRGGAKTVWENRNMRNHFNSCVLLDGYLYGFDESQLRCLDAETGKVAWTERGYGKGSLMAADGKLIVLAERGKLAVGEASPKGFRPTAEAKVLGGKCWSTPVLANGRIHARNAAGDVVCVDVRGHAEAKGKAE
jgi:hypothetical protein